MNDQDAPPSSLSVGLVIDGKYRLIALRGEGAMGSVWHAEHLKLGYAVAIKFLHKAVASLRDSRARFEREALIAARLGEASRHVTKVLDHGVLETGMPYVVMELLEGEGLDATLKREGRLALAEVARIIAQLARALEVAHADGVIHRDLKPANIFLCHEEDGESTVKLLDFGVAKATLENVSFATTMAGALIGTPSYMAPEQISMGIPVDARTDLWALAVVTYRLTTGQMPFGKGTLAELAIRIATVDPAPPTSIAGELPAAFDVWMRQGLSKKKEERFQSARAMATSLVELARAAAPKRASVPHEVVATRRDRPAAELPMATLVSVTGPNDATLVSPPPIAEADTMELPRTKASHGVLVGVIVSSLILGGLAAFALARSFVPTTAASARPEASIAPAPSQISPPPASSVLAPLDSLAPPLPSSSSSSTPHPTATHAHSHATTPHASSAVSAPAPSNDWNSRNQM
jgi:eukaryotic-like serine/threonine-protein kinase